AAGQQRLHAWGRRSRELAPSDGERPLVRDPHRLTRGARADAGRLGALRVASRPREPGAGSERGHGVDDTGALRVWLGVPELVRRLQPRSLRTGPPPVLVSPRLGGAER